MSQVKGLTSWTSISKRPKIKTKKSSKQICKKCKYYDVCLYKDLTRMDENKMFENNVKCENFNFIIEHRAQLTYQYDKLNKKVKRYSFSGKTEEEALNKALAKKVELDKNGGPEIINKDGKTLKTYIEEYINEKYTTGKIKESTVGRNNDTLDKLMKQSFINKTMPEITREELAKFFSTLIHYSESTIKQYYELIKHSFDKAFYFKVIPEDFFIGYNAIKKPKSHYVTKHPRKALPISEEKILLDYIINKPYYSCKHKDKWLIQLSIGLRLGEVLTLTLEDIDFDKKTLYVHRTITKVDNKFVIGEVTKTANGMRLLPMNKYLEKILRDAVSHYQKNKRHLLFCNTENYQDLVTESSVNRALKDIALKLKLGLYQDIDSKGISVTKTDVHCHMLRGTFATRCAEAKMAPKVLAKILGHSDPKVTNKYYVDISNDFVKSENKGMEAYLDKNNLFDIGNFFTDDKS